jgi:hypothetical protein
MLLAVMVPTARFVVPSLETGNSPERLGMSKLSRQTYLSQSVEPNADSGQVYYPFEKWGYIDSNFIIDEEHWYMAARISNDGMWRVSYGELNGLSRDEV